LNKGQFSTSENIKEVKNEIPEEHLLTKKEASNFLKISLPTLNNWAKKNNFSWN